MNTYEDDILARHSTPRLRRNQLDRAAKKDHLIGWLGRGRLDEVEKVLADMYPTTNEEKKP